MKMANECLKCLMRFRAASAKGGDDAIFHRTITSYLRKQIPRLSHRERELSKKNLHSFGSSLYTSCWEARSFFMQIRRTPSSQRGFRTPPRYKVAVNFPFHTRVTSRRNFRNVKNMDIAGRALSLLSRRFVDRRFNASTVVCNRSSRK